MSVMNDVQPDIKDPSVIAGQIEQETCYSLKSKKCQNPKTEVDNEHEYGFGLGQITITKKYNVFNELKFRFSELKDWDQDDRYNPKYQLLALFLYDKQLYKNLSKYALNWYENMAFMLASYNGGIGGFLRDLEICKNKCNCNHRIQFDNIEKYSYKSKSPTVYKKSFFEINREYVRNILLVRKFKYEKELLSSQ